MKILLYALEENAGTRLDVFLTETDELRDFTRSRLQKIISEGGVTVNGFTSGKSLKIKNGDKIEIFVPELKEPQILPENIPLDVLYEDEDVIVVNKPQGMVVHPAPGHYTGTLVNALLYRCKNSLSGINGVMRPGIVHRIDRDTSGVLVSAKNDFAHARLSEQLKDHSVTRIYEALVYGDPKENRGVIDKNIARSAKDRKKMAVTVSGGKRAVTYYEITNRYDGFSRAILRLKTGRTHQIRVHMAYINHPVLGDPVYFSAQSAKLFPDKFNGQALHAKTLGFIHPSKQIYMEFSANLPEIFDTLAL